MSDYFNQVKIEHYKEILKNINGLNLILDKYIKDTIEESYTQVNQNILDILNYYISNRQKVNENNKALIPYAKKMNTAILKTTNAINQNKFENIDLYKAFDNIKRNIEDKKPHYSSLLKIKNYDLNQLDLIKDTFVKRIKFYELKYLSYENDHNNECINIIQTTETSQLVRIISKINIDVFKIDLENFYNIYLEILSDLNKKSEELEIIDYISIIEADNKSFENIVDLLSNFELSFVSRSDKDNKALATISETIIEMYSISKKEIEYIKEQDIEKLEPIKSVSLQKFKNMVEKSSIELISDEKTFLKFSSVVTNIDNKIDEIKKLFTKILINDIEDNFNMDLKELNLSEELIKSFSKIILEIENIDTEKYNSEKSKEIINGILDTIKIKINNIEDSKKTLKETYYNTIITIKENVFKEIKNKTFSLFLKNDKKYTEIEKVQEIENLLNSINKTDIFETIENYDFNCEIEEFKKTSILQEISTFEEIINHSVKTLETIGDDNIKDFSVFMESISAEILSVLKNYNIELIQPKPYDRFDAKEHYVLLAEKLDNYKKGEIIKVVNYGFKENETVIIKANIVCAI